MQGGPAAFDFASAAMDMTGGRGPATIAAVLDRLTLNNTQKQAVLVGIADYMADAQEFRQARGGLPGARGPATAPARGATAGIPARGPTTPQDVQSALTTLRTSAEKLKTIIRQNVPAKDAGTLYDALDQIAPAQHLFGNP